MLDGEKILYVPWAEKRKEIREVLGDEEETAKAWDRGEDLIFIFIMTIALM